MRVVITERKYLDRPDPYRDLVETAGAEYSVGDCETETDVVETCRDADISVIYKAPMSREVIERLDRTRAIIRIGTGYDSVNVKAATEHGISVSNSPGYSRDEIATQALTLALSAAREVVYSDRDMRESNGFGERRYFHDVYGKTMGIVGLGRIGRSLVPKARGLDMDVVAFDPYVPEDVFTHLDVEKVTFDDLLSRADCVSVHAPLTAETHGMFGEREFARMKETAVFVNTARGPIMDEAALVDAVESGTIWAAGLDVFETEPPVDAPALSCDRIVCSPHHGGKTREAQNRCVEAVKDELGRALRGEHLENIVNPEVYWYSDRLLNPELDGWR